MWRIRYSSRLKNMIGKVDLMYPGQMYIAQRIMIAPENIKTKRVRAGVTKPSLPAKESDLWVD